MCPSESKVILNYDNVSGLENRYPDAIIQPYQPGRSKAKYYMADTVVIQKRKFMTKEQMCALAKDAAPLATHIIIDGMPDDRSHDNRSGSFRMYAFA